MTEEQQQNEGGFIERLRNSPRTVSTIIVILIIAGAIFAFSDRKQEGTTPSPEATTEAPEQSATPETSNAPEANKDGKKAVVQTTPTPLPQAKETGESFTEVATRGQSITVLARIATKRYIAANETFKNLSNEQKIYVEDYLKDQVKRQPLRVGGEVTFSKEEIKKGIEASQKLSDAQIKNLQKYAQRVNWN